jgi:type IV pilus assembly protein PilV
MSKKMIVPTSHLPRRRMSPAVASRRAAGFTLLEILIAMLVLAIGLLGIAAMQLRGLQYSHDAYLRSQISVLAYDMADRMRLNRANAASYAGTYTVPTTAPTGCTVTTVGATNDLACWRRQVFDAMPPGSTADIIAGAALLGTVTEYTVSLGWTDREGSTRTIQYTFAP